ncbi:hypothetical protein DPMN_104819 [Dreissena polymorpha]|uniref:Uncharacterized protein n=1 Tax=Dreissena polymorpha TaxID=45954 RepID=A0A9D4H8G1_DREPO|nr:hypothetical protein DPMN_104819 [Dreissena polymorpha]
MPVTDPRSIGLPHLVYLTDEGIFASVCGLQAVTQSREAKGCWSGCLGFPRASDIMGYKGKQWRDSSPVNTV